MFGNYEDGGLEVNVIPILMMGKTVENLSALEKSRRRGIRVVFRTALQDAFLRLTGQKISLQKMLENPKEVQKIRERK